MKFFTNSQIRQLDQYTIEKEPISSIDLMERAANALFHSFTGSFSIQNPVCILAGQGNNGGDALALARMLLNAGFEVSVFLIYTDSLSKDCETNKQRLISGYATKLNEFQKKFISPDITDNTIIVDGLFGSGLNRLLTGIYADGVNWINRSGCTVVSIDIPSGLSGEENKLTDSLVIVNANLTLSLQFPKMSFFYSENAKFIGDWKILDIGIHPEAIEQTPSVYNYLQENDIKPLLKNRSTFSHKGTYGHALILAGSKGMAGASVLSAKAAMRSGTGLVTVHGPEVNREIVQTSIPEVIFQSDFATNLISNVDSLELFDAVAIGPGIGVHTETTEMLGIFLNKINKPCILDADALNIISHNKELLKLIPENSILTPHPKEFERLFGSCTSSFETVSKAKNAAFEHSVIIVLKGAHTLIATPDGNLFFNSTGNSGMATGGSGDVLTGILVGLLAQGYKSEEVAKIGVFLHGRAGDLALKNESKESLIASDIISKLGKAFQSLKI
jgi:hydroxyethylthiazole kinase-like uncharacterized protein yjeF